MARLDALVIGRQRQLLAQQRGAFALGVLEVLHQHVGVGELEIMRAVLPLGTQEHVAIGHAGAVEIEIVNILDILHIHRQAFEPVGHFETGIGDRNAADLLEIGELTDFHPIAPDFPTQAPGTKRRAFPIILDEAEIVQQWVEADFPVAGQQQFLRIGRGRLHDDLVLIIMLQPVGVLAVAAIGGAAARLDIGGAPGLRPQGAQRGGGVEGAGAHLHIIGLQDHAALARPELVQAQDQFLETRFAGGRYLGQLGKIRG